MGTSARAFQVAAMSAIGRLEIPKLKIYGRRRKPLKLEDHEIFLLIYVGALAGAPAKSGPPIQMEMTERLVLELGVRGDGEEAHEIEMDDLLDRILTELTFAPEIWSSAFAYRMKWLGDVSATIGLMEEGDRLFLVAQAELAFVHDVVFRTPAAPPLTAVAGKKPDFGLDHTGDGVPNTGFEIVVPQEEVDP